MGTKILRARIRATPDTPYIVGDLSATLAAVMILQCVERRQLYLDDPIRKYGGELPEANVTIARCAEPHDSSTRGAVQSTAPSGTRS